MTLGRTSSGAINVKTDGGLRAVNCACCEAEPDCPTEEPSSFGFTLSEEQYKDFKNGGQYTMNAILSESYSNFGSCSSNLNGMGILFPAGPCSFSVEVKELKCGDGGYFGNAYFKVTWRVFKETGTNSYKLRYSGSGYCPYPFFGFCYSVGYFVSDSDDYSAPSYLRKIGNVSLTIFGSNFQLGVWTLAGPFEASASATINVTQQTPP